MPGMNGAELARLAVAKRPGLRVLLVSGYAEVGGPSATAMPAEVAMLQKPFRSVELVEKVHDLLGVPFDRTGGAADR
jgi:FixJ family two-component response regulator